MGGRPGTRAAADGVWNFRQASDPLTGKPFFLSTVTLPLDGGGTAKLQAECGQSGATLFFDIEFHTDDNHFLNVDTGKDEFRVIDSAGREQTVFRYTPHPYEDAF